jgi:superfamily II DNA or RNA helicase/HKD family nuclease
VADLSQGIYEHLITNELAGRLRRVESDLVERTNLDPTDAHEILARHIAALARRALRAVSGSDTERLAKQVEVANQIADSIARIEPRAAGVDDQVSEAYKLLTAIAAPPVPPAGPMFPVRPTTPLATGALLVNGRHQPRIGHEVAHELASADEVDLLCAFIKWHGLRLLERPIRELIERGGRLRVITTTYLGATDQRAVDRLAELGAEVKVSYETRTTRLHAKAWLFRRQSGASTAYVGSSNLSKAALVDGVEWNVRVSNLEQPHVIDTFEATFADYWSDPAFEEYVPAKDGDRLRQALSIERSPRAGGEPTHLDIQIANLDVRPYGYQQMILDDLDAERLVHGRYRNLVVMATGTGKTVVAALDYRRLRQAGTVDSLLFVAHQEQILRQSRSVFRHVLRDGSFGETLLGGERPSQWRHVFASIQSLHRLDLDAERFDMVIVDEFHHAEAPTYTRLLDRLRPRVLLGLTATPDRADGGDVRRWFGGRTAVELHLWEALERQLLAPFQYFGLHDDVDLSQLRWRRGQGYDVVDLDSVYTGNDARARKILQAVRDKVDVGRMRALGFCVSIGHAEFMAGWFRQAGVPAEAVTSQTDAAGRRALIEAFKRRELRVLFTVDLFNEGVDLPMVDTILLLRPTESATIFLQQLGRGLRLDDDKPCLTVLDFIGGQHAKFRFDLRWRALTGVSRRAIEAAVRDDFPSLPSGCHVELDRVAKEMVLANLRAALPSSKRGLVAELRQLGDLTLAEFLWATGLEIEDIYRSASVGGWAGLRRLAGVDSSPPGPDDQVLGRAIGRMLHLDDPDRLDLLDRVAGGLPDGGGHDSGLSHGGHAGRRLWDMLHFTLWGASASLAERDARLLRLRRDTARCAELRQVAEVLRDRINRVTGAAAGGVPLRVYASYSRNEACAAFGMENPGALREGVKWIEAERADLFFVTLLKAEQHYSPTTMYQDRAITSELFQWESQSTTSSASATGQRYIHHVARGSTVHLFVRETRVADGALGAPPYLYAGPMTYVSHTMDRPMRILWRLDHPLPADVYAAARVIAA